MILYEYEAKQLLFEAGVKVPQSQLFESADEEVVILKRVHDDSGVVLKAQVLSGKRAQAGGIVMVEDATKLKQELEDLFNETINGEKVTKVLVEEKVKFKKEVYLSISYDTDSRSPVLAVSGKGGTGIEERGVSKTYTLSPLEPGDSTLQASLNDSLIDPEVINKLIECFFKLDCTLLEINPLVQADDPASNGASGRWVALDAKIKLDDDAKFRHEEWNFAPRVAPGHTPTESEIAAKKIDEGDHRGTAGAAYFDLPGDIAVLSSGGGVSLTAMDALVKFGGKPANFTEYSGNPPKEKVVKLTKIVLSKPQIHGLWVVGTVVANFTDIYETLSGLIDGLREAEKELDTKFNFPIVIRRGGPKDKEAYEMLGQVKDFKLILQGEETSITQSAKTMAEKAKEYATAT